MFSNIISSEIFAYIILPILIFSARVLDVSIGTIRIIYVSKGLKGISTLCGFFEVLIWIIAISQIMQDLTNVFNYIAFAAGFAVGNYVGIILEDKIAMGLVSIWIITKKDATDLINFFSSEKYGVTSFAAKGLSGKVRIVITIIKRKHLQHVIKIVKAYNPYAFISVGDIRAVSEAGQPPQKRKRYHFAPIASFRSLRKGK